VIDAELLFPLLSAAVVVLGVPLWIAMIPPNRVYGLRTPATLDNESLWYAANRTTGRDIVCAGAIAFLFSVWLPDKGIGGLAYVLLMLATFALCGAGVVVIYVARARHLRPPPDL
jgi:uncharacterized membrane protein